MKVAIVGYGVEGRASYQYWVNQGNQVTIVDEDEKLNDLPDNVQTILGKSSLDHLADFDLVVRTPPLRPDRIKTNGKVWSATNEFFAKCPAPIIGVTGTKGKGTTCSLIAQMLKAVGKTVHLVGNIGVPALEVLPNIKADDIVVFELSSFQLWDLEQSPHIAVVLMIEPDHQDVHNTVEEYVAAKANIAIHQSENDTVIYHPSNQHSAEIAAQSAGRKLQYMTDGGAQQVGEEIAVAGVTICKISDVGLIGSHNLENICAAITAVWQYTQNVATFKNTIQSFHGLPHRLELVRELNGVKYYNDSYSANPVATIAAVQSFGQPTILLVGGFDRGQSYTNLAWHISRGTTIKKIIAYGQTAKVVYTALLLAGVKKEQVELSGGDLKDIVSIAANLAKSGDVVLLSPGSPSFDMFKNFEDRGEQFKKIVQELK